MSDRRIVIVGHRGHMGAMLIRRLEAAHRAVVGLDQPLEADAMANACEKAALVVFCVPAAVLGEVVARLRPHLAAETILADITSVKLRPMEEMERLWPGAVVGTHPLFGPHPTPGEDLPVAVTPGIRAGEEHIALVEGLFRHLGCRTFRTTARLHDEAMAAIQGLNFLSSAAYFAALAGREDFLPFLTPSFRRRQEAARKLLIEDAELFSGLVEANPFSQETVRRFRAFLSLAASGDTSLLARRAAWWWEKHQETP